MTPLGKFSLATLILGSAYLTANYLHMDRPVESVTWRRSAATPRQLVWQVRPTPQSGTSEMTEVPPRGLASSEPGIGQEAPKPPAFNSQVTFAALANAGPTEAAAAAASGTPKPGAGSAGAAAELLKPVAPADQAVRRPLLPLALAQPRSELSEIRRHEVVRAMQPAEITHHTVQFGDTLPLLAGKYLGNREEYLAIYLANQDVLANPADLAPGTVLKIPLRR